MKLPYKEKLEELRQKHNLRLVLLHGSQVDGHTHKDSDMDIAVLSEDPQKGFDLLELIGDLTDLFHSDKIDVSNLNRANPLLLFNATLKGELLAGKQADYEALKLLAFKRFHDYKPYFELEHNFVRERTKGHVSI